MSVQTQIARIENAKTAIKTAIEGKGVTVQPDTKIDGMAALIDSIKAGGGANFASVLDNASHVEMGTYTVASNTQRMIIPTMAKSNTHILRMVLLWSDTDTTNLGMFGLRGNQKNGLNGFQGIMTFRHAAISGIISKPSLSNKNAQLGEGKTGYGGGGIITLTVNGLLMTPYSSNFEAGTTYAYIIIAEEI